MPDQAYVGHISIGSPPVDAQVILDTGISSTWLYKYDAQSSSSFNSTNTYYKEIDHRRDQTQLEGVIAKDDMTFAGLDISSQPFLQLYQASPDPAAQTRGVLGLGLSTSDKPKLPDLSHALTPVVSLSFFFFFLFLYIYG